MKKTTIAIFAFITLVAYCQGRSHFPYSSEENSLSPFEPEVVDIPQPEGTPKNWLKVNHNFSRILRIRQGERLELPCEAIGSPVPRMAWIKSGRPITQSIEPESNDISNYAVSRVVTSYFTDCALPIHTGIYTCTAVAGGLTAVSSPVTVLVEGKPSKFGICNLIDTIPKINIYSTFLLQTTDGDVRLPCRAHGYPNPKIFWSHNGNLIHSSLNSRLKVLETGDLFIPKVDWQDMGSYTCVAENSVGTDSITTFLYPMKP